MSDHGRSPGREQRVHWRGRLINVGHLLTGDFVASLLALIAFTLTARALGPADYGLLALAYTYARAVEYFVSFQSWQPLIKYGAALTQEEQRAQLRSLLKFGLLLDFASSSISWVVAIGLAMVAEPFMNWEPRTTAAILLSSCSLLFRINGMPTAVLRIFGRFGLLAYAQMIAAVLRLGLCLLGVLAGAGLIAFIAIFVITQIISSLIYLILAFGELRSRKIGGVLSARLRGITAEFPGLWNFTWSTNLSLTIRSSAGQLDTLLVGALADPASAGFYHIAKRVGRMAQQVGVQVQAVLYPDLARLWVSGSIADFRKATYQTEWLLAGFGAFVFVFFLLAAEPLLRWTAGPSFSPAAPLLVVQTVAVMLTLIGTPTRSALLAMGRQRQVLQITLLGTVAFHATALILIPSIGAMGANMAHIVLGLVASVGMALGFRQAIRGIGDRRPEHAVDA